MKKIYWLKRYQVPPTQSIKTHHQKDMTWNSFQLIMDYLFLIGFPYVGKNKSRLFNCKLIFLKIIIKKVMK